MKALHLIVALFIMSLHGNAQTSLPLQGSSEILIHGTSTLHDWTSICEVYEGSAAFTFQSEKLVSISKLVVSIGVEGIKSGKSAMDKNTYKAMDSEKYPKVLFRSTAIEITPEKEGYSVSLKGNLTIHGVTKAVTIPCTLNKKGGHWVLSGKYEIHTPDYGIERVSAMMGTIKTGEEVVIDFDAVF